ncbi:MAG: TonB family protein [Candidatus Solibacter sp.]
MPDTALQTIPDFYTWGFAGAPIQVHLKLELVNRLRKQIQDTELGGGARPACGLLTGETVTPGVTAILDCKPLETLDALAEGFAGARASGVVGFYRTIAVGLDSMPDDDKALAERFFNHPNCVFLLIETAESSIGDARFCFWGERQIFDFPIMTFPLDAAELAVREAQRRASRAAAAARSSSSDLDAPGFPQAEELPVRVQESKAPQPVAKARRTSVRWWLIPALGIVALAAVLAAVLLNSKRGFNLPAASQAAPAVEVSAPLGLSVERRGADLRVSWNGNAERVSKADFGMLLIRGAGVSRDVPLTAEELHAGSVLYASAVDQLRFQLTVVAGAQVTREFLTIVMPQETANPVNRANVPGSPGGTPATGNAVRPAVQTRAAATRELRQFNDKRDASTIAHPGLDEPPAVNGAAPVSGSTPSLLNPVAVAPVSGPAPEISAAVTRQPSISDNGARPPVATNQVVPPVPALLRGMIWKPTAVDVNVAVDASGKVVKAEAVAKPGLHQLLREAAVQAALRWKFQPAQFDGHAVPANIVLQFNFAPNR